jgi:hypothetical protein
LADGNTRIYAIVFGTPADGVLALDGLKNKPVKAILQADQSSLPVQSTDNGLTITLPASVKDAKNFVVAVDVEGDVADDIAAGH